MRQQFSSLVGILSLLTLGGLGFSELDLSSKGLLFLITSSLPFGQSCIHTVLANVSRQLSDGKLINSWTDRWLSHPIVDILQIPEIMHIDLKATVSNFTYNSNWFVPAAISNRSAALVAQVKQITIPIVPCEDKIVWNSSNSGQLTLKEAYFFLYFVRLPTSWGQFIWHNHIPPSRSFMIWRLFHHKMPTDDNLKQRGLLIVSRCNLCGRSEESSLDLFLQCSFVACLWSWLSSIFSYIIQPSSFLY